jgi:hypothetical protein
LDRITADLRKAAVWSKDLSDQELHAAYKSYFTSLPALNRSAVLTYVDDDALGHIPAINKDTARMFQLRRELSDIHEAMLKAGR